MAYRINLEIFSGPLDLLLFFIHRDRVNIYDIPIANITREFLEYINLMRSLNMEIAGDFIVMAALLMRVKAKMLLPRDINANEDEIEDPRIDLVQQLLEYKQFKNASQSLEMIHHAHSLSYSKGVEIPIKYQKENPAEFLKNVTLFDLMAVYKEVLDRLPETTPYELSREPVHLKEQIHFIREKIKKQGKISFRKMIGSLKTKLHIVVTFMAILDLIQRGELLFSQKEPFSEIIITGAKN